MFPKLFQRVPRASVRELALHTVERASIAVLVAAAIFQLVMRRPPARGLPED